jgi:hypothetical protein
MMEFVKSMGRSDYPQYIMENKNVPKQQPDKYV